MKKLLTLFIAVVVPGILIAGGLVTNTNQSAAWVRMPSRNASTSIDAVYYNPAGLLKLENGFHFSVSNQTIFQKRKVENFYRWLNDTLFTGDVKAPIFPGIYAAYKMDRLAIWAGFNPIGGGGGAEYKEGLPSFELSISDLVPALASQNVTGYRLDSYLKGSSVYFGIQGGVSFKINDWLSVAAGLRYVIANNSYVGHLKDVELQQGSNWVRADAILNGIASQLTAITTIPTQLSPIISAGGGDFTIAQLVAAGQMTVQQQQAIYAALGVVGVPSSNIPLMTVNQISGTITAASPTLLTNAAKYSATATVLGDQEADVKQTGSGISPIFSVNISPSENLNIAIRYEMKTSMQLENKTTKDFLVGFTETGTPITMFPDGILTPSDMPAMLALGLDYSASDNLRLSCGLNYFFDKNADYGHKIDHDLKSTTPSIFISNKEIIKHNGWSLNFGAEYGLSEKLLLSGGYSFANKGVNDKYQSDMTFGLATHTLGAGGAYKITDNILLNAGFSYSFYMKDRVSINHMSPAGIIFQPDETYHKNAMVIGVGVDFSF